MKPEEIRQLLGGYASGTLSEAEKKLLFEAALEDQVLFDAMADEQSLKDLLDDPESRGYLQAVLDETTPELESERDVPIRRMRTMQAIPLSPSPVPSQAAIVGPSVTEARRRHIPVWWGLLAAAGLAGVSVLGILQFNDHKPAPPAAEVATAGKPAGQPQSIPPPILNPSAPANDSKHAEAKAASRVPAPIPASKTAQPPAVAPARGAALEPELDKTKQQKESQETAKVERRKDAGQVPTEQASRDQKTTDQAGASSQTVEVQAAPLQISPAPSAGLPAPQQNSAVAPSPDQSYRNAMGAQPPRDQVQLAKAQPPSTPASLPEAIETARQLYFAGQSSSTQTSAAGAGGGSSAGGIVRKKNSPPAGVTGGAIGRSAPAGATTHAVGAARLKTVPTLAAQPGFAMRYRLLRKTGSGEFAPVAPDTRFRIGEEVVVAIEKNSGGLASINRIAGSDSTSVPMAIQTSQMARSVPLTVIGPMELVLMLVQQTATVVPLGLLEPPPTQKSESADDMVYIAEPASASAAPLVVRIPIRVQQ